LQVLKTEKFYTMAAAAAIIKYSEHTQKIVLAASSLRITYEGAQKTMVVGGATATQLELLFNARHSSVKGTLYEALDHCKNDSGKRLLRTEILQPSTSPATIKSRLDVVRCAFFDRNLHSRMPLGSHACSLEANMRVTNGIPLGWPLFLPVHTVNCVQTLKVEELTSNEDLFVELGKVLERFSSLDKLVVGVLRTSAIVARDIYD
jgi:hypothetical protein